MSVPRLASINFESSDPVQLATFWGALLDGELVIETPQFCVVRAGSIHLSATRVEGYEPPTWPSPERSQQMHLDLAVENLDAAEQHAIGLGATAEPHQPSPERSRVLRDPAGHPFCIRATS